MLRRITSPPGPVSAGVALLVLALALALRGHVEARDLAAFVGFHLLWVLGPGVLAARLLLPTLRGPLAVLAMGWGLGYGLEVGVYAATAQIGARDAFLAWPAVAILGAIAVGATASRRTAGAERTAAVPRARLTRGAALALAVIAAFLLVYLAAVAADDVPLPSGRASHTYSTDFVWNLALAAEAKEHWPMRDPQVAGERLPYHIGWSLDAAAAARVTGVDLPTVVSRLAPLPLLLAMVLGFGYAGVALIGAPWAGPLALGAVLLGSDSVGLIPGVRDELRPFLNDLVFSPSFLFGLVLFLPALVLAGRRPPGPRALVALAVLLAGCAVSKGVLAPLLFGALAVPVAVTLAVRRIWDRRELAALALAVAVLVGALLTVFAGGGTILKVRPLTGLWSTPNALRDTALAVPVGVIATALSLLAAFAAPLVALRWAPWPPSRVMRFLLGVGLVGLVAGFTLWDASLDQGYFVEYGLVAAALVAGAGLARRWEARGRPSPAATRTVAVVAGLLAVEFVIAGVARHAGPGAGSSRPIGERQALLLGLAVAWISGGTVLIRRGLTGTVAPLAVVVVLLGAATRQLGVPSRLARVVHGEAQAATPAGLRRVDHHGRGPGSAVGLLRRIPLPAGVASGLAWVRGHLPADAVLVVPARRGGLEVIDDFGYAAFAERRVVMGGTSYSTAAGVAGYDRVSTGAAHPYAGLVARNAAVYRCDRRALAALVARRGATHLVVDRTTGPVPPCVLGLGHVLYDNGVLAVSDVTERAR